MAREREGTGHKSSWGQRSALHAQHDMTAMTPASPHCAGIGKPHAHRFRRPGQSDRVSRLNGGGLPGLHAGHAEACRQTPVCRTGRQTLCRPSTRGTVAGSRAYTSIIHETARPVACFPAPRWRPHHMRGWASVVRAPCAAGTCGPPGMALFPRPHAQGWCIAYTQLRASRCPAGARLEPAGPGARGDARSIQGGAEKGTHL
jgi:hypothetical protein